ncbi:MAG TPA: metalloregulator ArsR/SmtB family transcription factor [Phycisphaerae bacterium]|jgi:DNA-binding transcriptional ArsR family regulator
MPSTSKNSRPLPSRAPRPPRKPPAIPRDDHFAQAFAALGEPTRLRIMQLLPREPICEEMYNVVELAEELGLRQPTVSHHLKILAESGMIQARRHCNSIYYYVDQRAVVAWLKQVKCRFGCEGCKE